MICINHFVLITWFELSSRWSRNASMLNVFLISIGSELVVRMLGQIILDSDLNGLATAQL